MVSPMRFERMTFPLGGEKTIINQLYNNDFFEAISLGDFLVTFRRKHLLVPQAGIEPAPKS